jgi:hypothetical protein
MGRVARCFPSVAARSFASNNGLCREIWKWLLLEAFQRVRPDRRYLDGKGEIYLIYLARSQAPGGRQR